MSQDPDRSVIPSSEGMFSDLSNRVKLIVRLMGDRRVSPLLKLLPIGSLLYFIAPDIVIGPIDDVAVIWLGSYLFVELCPPHVVEEHRAALRGQPLPGPADGFENSSDEVIEGEYWEDKQ